MNHFMKNTGCIKMEGGNPLNGRLKVQGSKNATLPIMAACLLIQEKCVLKGCPDITDVEYMCRLLEHAGAEVGSENTSNGVKLCIEACDIGEYHMPEKYVTAMRSSIMLMGAFLGRIGEVCIHYPGGCVLGSRPVDIHLYALEKLGAQIWTEGNHIHAYADELRGAEIRLPFPSVGATENAILAAVTAKGTTVIKNAAKEPEITELCSFLNMAGADIKLQNDFAYSGRIVIHGVEINRLHGVEYEMAADRIVAGTYLLATLATGGSIVLENCPVSHMASTFSIIKNMGGRLCINNDEDEVCLEVCNKETIKNVSFVETGVYPEFPTDLQSPLMVVACVSDGRLELRERIFASRFKIMGELQRMGAHISLKGTDTAVIDGCNFLIGRNVIAKELRGGAALVIAGLVADGITTISNVDYINRGYQNISQDFARLGAKINNEK